MDQVKQRPKVGIGVYILNDGNQLLLTLRKNVTGAGKWCPPGGHLEMGEQLIDCVKRETKEESGIDVQEAELWAVNNNIMGPDRHYINLDYLATKWGGEPQNMEQDKCERLEWFDLGNLPTPLLEPTENFFKNNPLCICRSGKKYLDCHGIQVGVIPNVSEESPSLNN